MVQYECQLCKARIVGCESGKLFSESMEENAKIRKESPVLLFLRVATSAGTTAFFNRMGAGQDAANPRNPC